MYKLLSILLILVYSTQSDCPTFMPPDDFKIKPYSPFNSNHDTLQLTWSSKSSSHLFAVSSSVHMNEPSDIFLSENSGLSFKRITENIKEPIFIHKGLGLQINYITGGDEQIFVICNELNPNKTITKGEERTIWYMTKDLGKTWTKQIHEFSPDGKFYFNPKKPERVLFKSEFNSQLYLSKDHGNTWAVIQENVSDVFWSIYNFEDPAYFYFTKKVDKQSYILFKASDVTDQTQLMDSIVRFWAPKGHSMHDENGNKEYETNSFLYVLKLTGVLLDKFSLYVTKDGGLNFKTVFLPRITKDAFFDILDVGSECAFLHMEEKRETGFGTLYRSDASGRIFSPSLRYHFYLRKSGIHDFTRINSLRGTYITSKFVFDHKLETMITHDRGLTWNKIYMVENVNKTGCDEDVRETPIVPFNHTAFQHLKDIIIDDENLIEYLNETLSSIFPENDTLCSLQISNKVSIARGVKAFNPVSLATAPGLIIASGHYASHLKQNDADVFISQDGGNTWRKALNGPHNIYLMNHGGIILAVSMNKKYWPDSIKYSLDKGVCWEELPIDCSNCDLEVFTRYREKVKFTGLVTTPDGSAMEAALYGYGEYAVNWLIGVMNFKNISKFNRICTEDDFEPWHHSDNQCHLGIHGSYNVLKNTSICLNDGSIDFFKHTRQCECREQDFECEYGYYRDHAEDVCMRNPNVPIPDIEVMSRSEIQEYINLGYQKHPGNKCVGGWRPDLYKQKFLIYKRKINKNFVLIFSTLAILVFILTILLVVRCKLNKMNEYSRFAETKEFTENSLKKFMNKLKPQSKIVTDTLATGSNSTSSSFVFPPAVPSRLKDTSEKVTFNNKSNDLSLMNNLA